MPESQIDPYLEKLDALGYFHQHVLEHMLLLGDPEQVKRPRYFDSLIGVNFLKAQTFVSFALSVKTCESLPSIIRGMHSNIDAVGKALDIADEIGRKGVDYIQGDIYTDALEKYASDVVIATPSGKFNAEDETKYKTNRLLEHRQVLNVGGFLYTPWIRERHNYELEDKLAEEGLEHTWVQEYPSTTMMSFKSPEEKKEIKVRYWHTFERTS